MTEINTEINTEVNDEVLLKEEYENLLATVGSLVWNDIDKDGVPGEEERGVFGVKVTLYNASNNEATEYSTITDSEGNYVIENIDPGEYYAVFDPGPDYEFIEEGGYVDSLGRSKIFTLNEGESNLLVNAPIIKSTGSIKGKIFKDISREKSYNDILYEGVKVLLLNENGTIEEKETNGQGIFSFNNLVDGKYKIIFNDTNKARCLSSRCVEHRVLNGEEFTYANAVYESTGATYSIGGRVFIEKAQSGILEIKDTLVNGIIVELYKDGRVIKRTLTCSIKGIVGTYKFSGLESGKYTIQFILPNGSKFGQFNSSPYGSKVAPNTGAVEVNIIDIDEIDINASINIKK